MPQRGCVAVAELRKRGYTDLRHWINSPGNVLCTRRGRIFINEQIFYYPQSEWCNPFKVDDANDSATVIARFEWYLRDKLQNDPNALSRFIALRYANEIGCFCKPHESCHTDIILYYLNNIR